MKPYGWGIVDGEGLHVDYSTTEENANTSVKLYNHMRPESGPYRTIQLFYKEEGE